MVIPSWRGHHTAFPPAQSSLSYILTVSIPGDAPKKSRSHLNALPWKPNPQHWRAIDLFSSIKVSRFDSLSPQWSLRGSGRLLTLLVSHTIFYWLAWRTEVRLPRVNPWRRWKDVVLQASRRPAASPSTLYFTPSPANGSTKYRPKTRKLWTISFL